MHAFLLYWNSNFCYMNHTSSQPFTPKHTYIHSQTLLHFTITKQLSVCVVCIIRKNLFFLWISCIFISGSYFFIHLSSFTEYHSRMMMWNFFVPLKKIVKFVPLYCFKIQVIIIVLFHFIFSDHHHHTIND